MTSYTGLSADKAWERLHRVLGRITNEENRGVVERYLKERRAAGIKFATLGSDATCLRHLCDFLGERTFEEVTRDVLIEYVNAATSKRMWRSVTNEGEDTVTTRTVALSQSTMNKRKRTIRAFFRWLRDTDEYPPEVKGLKETRTDNGFIPVDDLITRDDLQKLLTAHPHPRDEAIITVLYEGGLRAGELCSLNISNVHFDEYGAVLLLPKHAEGLKTGARRVRLLDSASYLHAWVEAHPRKEEPGAPLFFSMSRRAPGKRMTGSALWSFCKRAAKKAGLKKHVHPHLFRHSSATEKARQGWTEAEMRGYFGWSRSSDMPARYNHLAGLDYEDMMLERYGVKAVDGKRKRALAPRKCSVCDTDNQPNALFCQSCRHPVSPKAEEELERRRQEELKETATRLIAEQMKEEIAEQVRRAVGARNQA